MAAPHPRPQRPAASADRLPPHAPTAEQAALSCLLGGTPETALLGLNECEERAVTPLWFYDGRHQAIYAAMAALHAAGQGVDTVAVWEHLRAQQGGGKTLELAYLMETANKVGVPSMLPQYLATLEERFHQRRLLQICAGVTDAVYGEKPDVAAIRAAAEKEVLELGEDQAGRTERPMQELVRERIEILEHYHRGHVQQRGQFTTGVRYLDTLLGGLGGANGNLIVLAGRPGTGKTSLALQIATHVATEAVWWTPRRDAAGHPAYDAEGHALFDRHESAPAGVFSLEMEAGSLTERMLFARAGADLQRWRTGFAEKSDQVALVKAAGELGHAVVVIDDSGRCTIEQLRARARRWARQYGARLFVVDYIQLLRSGGRRFREDRVQELAEISGELQALAKELFSPFIVLAQMNRDYEKDPTRAPRLSDLKDCGAIEQDADVVGFLYTPKINDEKKEKITEQLTQVYGEDWSRHPERVNLLVAKNRFGPTGKVEMLFQKSSTRFLCWDTWQKEHGFKGAAAGERAVGPKQTEMDEAL